MKDIIISIIEQAEKEENYSLLNYAKQLIEELVTTINAPSNWRSIGTELAEKYGSTYRNGWVYEELELWNYEEKEEEED